MITLASNDRKVIDELVEAVRRGDFQASQLLNRSLLGGLHGASYADIDNLSKIVFQLLVEATKQ